MPSTIHSASGAGNCRCSSSRWVLVSCEGTRPSALAVAITASSAGDRPSDDPSKALATVSEEQPRLNANVHVWAEQYAQLAARLETYLKYSSLNSYYQFGELMTYIPSPTKPPGPAPRNENGRFKKFGTITLYVQNAGGHISR